MPLVRSARNYRRTEFKFNYKSARHDVAKLSLAAFFVVLLAILAFVVQKPRTSAVTQSTGPISDASVAPNPLDQLASANIALTVARMDRMPETIAITNQADSREAQLAMASTASTVVSKPQIVTTALKSRADIITYITKPNDTASSLAAKFGVTTDSIIWSNGLNSNDIAPHQKLLIPPVNGVVYRIQPGDTVASLARRFSVSKNTIISFNDAEIGGLKVGEIILIPHGVETTTTPSYNTSLPGSFPWGSSPIYGYNGYDWGNCTWYVASQIPVPSNWGNADTWAYYAGLSGWNVNSTPSVGAIAQTPYAAGGLGHVAIVEAVNGNMIKYSDMNNYGDGGGFGIVGHSGWEPASTFSNYITH
jgi:surface antigen